MSRTTELLLARRGYSDEATEGDLFDMTDPEAPEFLCYTLEDPVREPGVKIPGKTAIPEGRYRVVLTLSPRFGEWVPLLLDVPMFVGIRIHWGNSAKDTEGCILVGDDPTLSRDNWVGKSRVAYNRLVERIREWLEQGPVYITIHNGPQVKEVLG